jgi:hypothetical protein
LGETATEAAINARPATLGLEAKGSFIVSPCAAILLAFPRPAGAGADEGTRERLNIGILRPFILEVKRKMQSLGDHSRF